MSKKPVARARKSEPFWRTKTLDAMFADEWESLCDGCGKCCLHKFEDEDTGAISHTRVACRLLNLPECRCADYPNRKKKVRDCETLTATNVPHLRWLPATCAYRLVWEGKDLPWWHPLVSGDPETVHEAGVSVRGRVVSEDDVGDLEDFLINWALPGGPIKRRPKKRYAED